MIKREINRIWKVMLVMILAVTTVLAAPVRVSAEENDHVKSFVMDLYQIGLERDPSQKEIDSWVTKLTKQHLPADTAAYRIFMSAEFGKKNYSDETYVEKCYQVLLNREAGDSEKKNWVKKLDIGLSRTYVLSKICAGEEFENHMKKSGLHVWKIDLTQPRDQYEGLTAFISRLYTKALGRKYDIAGLNGWCRKVITVQWTMKDTAAIGFMHSAEFLKKKLNNTEFVKVLYRTFLDREGEAKGVKGWVDALNKGMRRDTVIGGFAKSKEFENLMKKSGLPDYMIGNDPEIKTFYAESSTGGVIAVGKYEMSAKLSVKDNDRQGIIDDPKYLCVDDWGDGFYHLADHGAQGFKETLTNSVLYWKRPNGYVEKYTKISTYRTKNRTDSWIADDGTDIFYHREGNIVTQVCDGNDTVWCYWKRS